MTTFAREDVAAACKLWGGLLWLPAEIDGRQLLWALSGCESSFGENASPRHEPAYDVGGEYAENPEQAKLLAAFGSSAACSYGPWQIMLVNCTAGTSPEDMLNVRRCASETAYFINRRILHSEGAKTVAQIAEAYNSGKWAWKQVPAGVARYAADCEKYYATVPMPGVVVTPDPASVKTVQ